MRRCFLKFDKLIVDDNAYIYNDMEGRVEKLPHKVMINWLRGGQTGFEKYKKWAKVDTCFSLIKPSKKEILHFVRPL